MFTQQKIYLISNTDVIAFQELYSIHIFFAIQTLKNSDDSKRFLLTLVLPEEGIKNFKNVIDGDCITFNQFKKLEFSDQDIILYNLQIEDLLEEYNYIHRGIAARANYNKALIPKHVLFLQLADYFSSLTYDLKDYAWIDAIVLPVASDVEYIKKIFDLGVKMNPRLHVPIIANIYNQYNPEHIGIPKKFKICYIGLEMYDKYFLSEMKKAEQLYPWLKQLEYYDVVGKNIREMYHEVAESFAFVNLGFSSTNTYLEVAAYYSNRIFTDYANEYNPSYYTFVGDIKQIVNELIKQLLSFKLHLELDAPYNNILPNYYPDNYAHFHNPSSIQQQFIALTELVTAQDTK